jgi:tRNA (guanine-N7-)-methyltransferase
MSARSVRRSTSSFKPRRRRLSERRRADLARWMETYGIDATGPPIDWPAVFGRASSVVLDVGFGHGESLLDVARRAPERDVVGVEVHTPGVATVLDAVEREGLTNVRVVHGDVLELLDRIPATSLGEIRVLFPDPWPKERQHHRRLVRADVVAAFTDRLHIGGVLRLATDVGEYADCMEGAAATDRRLSGGRIDSADDRPITRFERRGLDEGRTSTDLRYRRVE